jgi:hypothetical protein
MRQASGRVQTRVIGAGGVVHTASPAEAWFGLGTDAIESIDVQWPSGRRTQHTVSHESSVILDEGT